MDPEQLEILLLAFGGLGAFTLGFGIAWWAKPAPPPRTLTPGTVFDDALEAPTAVDIPIASLRSLPTPPPPSASSDSRESASARVSRPATPAFEAWKEQKIDQKKSKELEEENKELQSLYTLLPGVTRRLTECATRREIASLLAEMIPRLCLPPPERVLVFLTSKEAEEVVLVGQQGYDERPQVQIGMRVPMLQGMLGLSVRRQCPVDRTDFERDPMFGASKSEAEQPFHVEIAAPVIHNRKVEGIIAIDGVPENARNAKRMLAVGANLTALALMNADAKAKIQRMADTDGLTGLYNRRYCFEALDRLIAEHKKSGKSFSVMLFDIDHFKKYNDQNGHQAGDDALRVTAAIVRESLKPGYVAARYGGEEFIIALPATDRPEALRYAEGLRYAVLGTTYEFGAKQPLGFVSISGGVATYPADAQDSHHLIEAADARLYKVKEAGRNGIRGEG